MNSNTTVSSDKLFTETVSTLPHWPSS